MLKNFVLLSFLFSLSFLPFAAFAEKAGQDVCVPSKKEAMEAVKVLIAWMGDDPGREGVIDTPRRVVEAFQELFKGYTMDPSVPLQKTFCNIEGYDDMIIVEGIPFESHCEHHILPFKGVVHVGYMPDKKVVGLSKIPRVVEIFSRRLQIQEKMTAQIAQAMEEHLHPKGVIVVVSASHGCVESRGIQKKGSLTQTVHTTGKFASDKALRKEFLKRIQQS